jgi:hypothetical protein
VIAVFRPTRQGDADAVLRCVRILRAVQAVIERRDCGTGAGGFKPGNKCGAGGGGGGEASPQVKAWAEKKFAEPEHAKAFTEWFGGSQVTDGDGQPRVVYHGTDSGFDEFDPGKIGSATDPGELGAAFYFSTDAKVVGDKKTAGMPVYLKAEIPLRLKAESFSVNKKGLVTAALGIDSGSSAAEITAAAIKAGFDSVVLDYSPIGYNHSEIAVFTPTQIKSATGNSGSFDPKNPKITRAMRAGNQSATTRDCGTGAGGFKPGNKCAGGGGAGAGDSGASGGGSSGSVEQAKPGDGPLVKAAREEHKKALDKMRKAIETAEVKAQAKFQEKWDAHAPLKAKLDDHLALVDKISAEHESLVKQVMADPKNEALAQRMRESGQELLDERVAIEPLEKAEAKARNDREKSRHEMRTAVAKALAKESAAVDKEDGLTTAQRKRSLDAVEQTHRSGSQITQWAQEQGLPESISLSQRESAVESRVQAQEFLRSAVNPTIHTRALEGPIEYKDGVRANAAGTAESYESIHGGSSDVRAVVGRTQLSPTDSASTVIHEFGHQIEHGNVEAARLCHDFLQSRVAGEQAVSFSAKFQGYGYGTDEKGSPDDFLKAVRAAYGVKPDADSQYAESIAHYAGKRYEGNGKTSESGFTTYGATEVLSIGLELLAKDARAFAAADPEWFDLVVGISTGRLLNKTRSQRRKG